MAVKKTTKKEEVNIEVTPEVKEEVTETKKSENKKADIEVDVKPLEDTVKVSGNVRIRMNADHRCYIGGEFYNLTKGQCYNVPQNVKDVLNRAGLLAPL